eukprot:COSAG01_NODE_1241_length_11085_cov_9.712361_19_plen_54_part_00
MVRVRSRRDGEAQPPQAFGGMPTTKQLIDAALSKRRAPKRGRGTVDSGSRKPH